MKEQTASSVFNEKSHGVFIVNEGLFWSDNASLSYYSIDSQKVQNNIFQEANSVESLGDVANSMFIHDTIGYVVINNSGKIYALHTETFKYLGKIIGLVSPRYFHLVNETKAYVTDLYGKTIYVVNPLTFSVDGQINVDNNSGQFYQHATEQMVQYNEFVFVNCWSFDNQILVINSNTDDVVDSIQVPIQPKAMVMDKFDHIWVLTDGGYDGNPYGYEQPALIAIDPETREILKDIRFDIETSPADIAINSTKDTLYFINGDVYRYIVSSDSEPELFIESPYSNAYLRGFSAIGVDPNTNEIYLADAIDNTQNGNVYRYKPSGIAIDTFKVGILPTYFAFK
ncbi:MAG: cell surface protein [Salinivirgaceae bacterium]|nr:MAG: cell surface protein [Salinivirgaceae bacterium]